MKYLAFILSLAFPCAAFADDCVNKLYRGVRAEVCTSDDRVIVRNMDGERVREEFYSNGDLVKVIDYGLRGVSTRVSRIDGLDQCTAEYYIDPKSDVWNDAESAVLLSLDYLVLTDEGCDGSVDGSNPEGFEWAFRKVGKRKVL